MTPLLEQAIQHIAAGNSTYDERWRFVDQIWKSGARLAEIIPLVESVDERVRSFAVDILQVAASPTERDEITRVLRQLLSSEKSAQVLASTVNSLNHLAPPDLIELVIPFGSFPNSDVREAVARALTGSLSREAIDALIALSQDQSDDVRNWATFALGSELADAAKGTDRADDPSVTEALFARLSDVISETRAEAVLGLAMRGDSRVIPNIRCELERGTEWSHYIDSAFYLATPELCEPLRNRWERADESERRVLEFGSGISIHDAIRRSCE